MTRAEVKSCVHLLGQLFPGQLTEEQARLAVEKIQELDHADVERAIKAHREAYEFITWPQLFEACRAAERERAERGRAAAKAAEPGVDNSKREGSWADVYRRQNPQLAGASDYEVVLRVHRGWWFRCGGSAGYRKMIVYSCTSKLVSFGMDPADAEKWAETVFEDSPEFFRQCLDEIRAVAEPREAVPA